MKKTFFILLVFLSIISSTAQQKQIYKGKITDTNNTPLIGAAIIATIDSKTGTITDSDGLFQLELNSPNVTISYMGYKNRTVSLKTNFTTIILEEDIENLEGVVISASREEQRRAEVPVAITAISAKKIADTKAFGIEQLVNQVPGVFMSTSKTASNEQHFMAVRTPISTKSLFLYIEDGIPIRPTAVFNHNALLEMNTTAIGRIEVMKGPASSIYGSEAIGGSFNFITKKPTKELSGSLGFQINDLGLTRYEFEVSDHVNENLGIYLGTHYVQRQDGPIAHSNYEKLALTFKTVHKFGPSAVWTNVIDLVDFRSDMSGSLSQDDYTNGNYESDQTFSERDAFSFRFRSTLHKYWNDNNKTAFNLVYRDNRMNQIPSYRIRQSRNKGKLTGTGSGEINSNQFNSFVALVQHKINFNVANSSLIIGASADYSPQDYVADKIKVTVDPITGKNTDYDANINAPILNYNADIFNYAGYFQYEISPIEALKITAALRYDRFEYNYDNNIEGTAGPKDSKNYYDNFSPKIGMNYNFSSKAGLYINYSNGFTPPQVSSLYRNKFVGVGGDVFNLKPSNYDNYEIGGYAMIANKWKLDAALYLLDGKNTLVTMRDENDAFFNANAGKTRSYGIEYGITYTPTPELSISHNGSFAKHRYINFFEKDIDYSDTDRSTAPSLLGMSNITYKPNFIKNFAITAEHELVGSYNTSFENQVKNADDTRSTATYDGHNIINLRASYQYKSFEIWTHALNIFDDLYAARASYNQYRKENSYTIGNPRAFHAGIKFNF